jgi:hypothetical protein
MQQQMRRYIDLVEARRPVKARMNTSGFAVAITQVMRKFASKANYGIKFNQEWVDAVKAHVTERKNFEVAEALKYGDPPPAESDWANLLVDTVDKLWHSQRDTFDNVRRNVAIEEEEYQQRAAERHNRLDDLSFHIESSDYLSGMAALVRCAEIVARSDRLSDPQTAKTIIDRCDWFIEQWEDHLYGGDGGEQPVMDSDFAAGIERLFPLLLLLYPA